MALADKIAQEQAESLVPIQKVLRTLAAVVGRVWRLCEKTPGAEPDGVVEVSQIELPNELELTSALKELAQKEQRGTTATLDESIKTLATLAKIADARITELENKLRAMREALVRRENENSSLQNALDLIANENSRLSCRLADSQAEADKACVALARAKTALTVVEGGGNKVRQNLLAQLQLLQSLNARDGALALPVKRIKLVAERIIEPEADVKQESRPRSTEALLASTVTL